MKRFTVTEISSSFHNFSGHSYTQSNNIQKSKSKYKNTALLLATSNIDSSLLQKRIGIAKELEMLDMYEIQTGAKIVDRNTKTHVLEIGPFTIIGRPDGMIENENIVIEHKRRTRGLVHSVPYHERVQCHIYMKMTASTIAHLVESFGEHIQTHVIHFDDALWKEIVGRIQTMDTHKTCSKVRYSLVGLHFV